MFKVFRSVIGDIPIFLMKSFLFNFFLSFVVLGYTQITGLIIYPVPISITYVMVFAKSNMPGFMSNFRFQ